MGSCFSANKKHVRTNRQSYNGTQKIVGGNIMQNMTLEYDEVLICFFYHIVIIGLGTYEGASNTTEQT